MPDYNWDYTENPCAALLTTKDRMRAIANVADVLFEPSLTSPKYTGTFADGQRITFDPNTVDWQQLERTCRNWSQRYIIREFGKSLVYRHEFLERWKENDRKRITETFTKTK